MTTSTTSPHLNRFGMEFSPVPMEVEAVTIFLPVRSSNRGMSSRCAAVKAPEVITLMSCEAVFIMDHALRKRVRRTNRIAANGSARPSMTCMISKSPSWL